MSFSTPVNSHLVCTRKSVLGYGIAAAIFHIESQANGLHSDLDITEVTQLVLQVINLYNTVVMNNTSLGMSALICEETLLPNLKGSRDSDKLSAIAAGIDGATLVSKPPG